MPTLYLTTPGLQVSLSSNKLDLTFPEGHANYLTGKGRQTLPFTDIEYVVVDASVRISFPVLCEFLRKEVPVLILNHGRLPLGQAMPCPLSPETLAAQVLAQQEDRFVLEMARAFVVAKIKNQKRMLQRLSANRQQPCLTSSWLDAQARQASAAQTLDTIRGFEGTASGRYFETLAGFFPAEFPFVGRNRRPPKDPPNALLSFGYTLLISEVSIHLHACGLHPGFGFLHSLENGRPSLALDLIEPFRAPVIDALVLDQLNHKRFQACDFETTPQQAVLLRSGSRKRFIAALEMRLEREFLHEQSGHRTTLRQLMRRQCQALKKSILEKAGFEPFLMN